MSKERSEKIAELLGPRERLLYNVQTHYMIYAMPIIVAIAGVVLLAIPEEMLYRILVRTGAEIAIAWLQGAREVFLGYWMIIGGVIFTTKAYFIRKNLIQIVTSKRVLECTNGLISSKIEEMEIGEIHHIRVQRNLIDRLSRRGHIHIIGQEKLDVKEGTNKRQEMFLYGVVQPKKFIEAIEKAKSYYDKMHSKKRYE